MRASGSLRGLRGVAWSWLRVTPLLGPTLVTCHFLASTQNCKSFRLVCNYVTDIALTSVPCTGAAEVACMLPLSTISFAISYAMACPAIAAHYPLAAVSYVALRVSGYQCTKHCIYEVCTPYLNKFPAILACAVTIYQVRHLLMTSTTILVKVGVIILPLTGLFNMSQYQLTTHISQQLISHHVSLVSLAHGCRMSGRQC